MRPRYHLSGSSLGLHVVPQVSMPSRAFVVRMPRDDGVRHVHGRSLRDGALPVVHDNDEQALQCGLPLSELLLPAHQQSDHRIFALAR